MRIKALNKTLLGKVEGLQRHSKLDFTVGNANLTKKFLLMNLTAKTAITEKSLI